MTMHFTQKELLKIKRYFRKNRIPVRMSLKCACLECLSIFDANEVTHWIGEAHATCPKCGSSSILPDSKFPITQASIKSLYAGFESLNK